MNARKVAHAVLAKFIGDVPDGDLRALIDRTYTAEAFGGDAIVPLTWLEPGGTYIGSVAPGVIVIGIGLTITVAPLTTAVLAAVEDAHAGIASAINNAVARIAGLLAVAIIPAAAGLSGEGLDWTDGWTQALVITAIIAATGGVVSWLTIRKGEAVRPTVHPSPQVACQDPCVAEPRELAGASQR